jgi:hypothetical protein
MMMMMMMVVVVVVVVVVWCAWSAGAFLVLVCVWMICWILPAFCLVLVMVDVIVSLMSVFADDDLELELDAAILG